MAANSTAIANLALAYLLTGRQIGAITGAEQEAVLCNLWYPQVLAEIYEGYDWNHARVTLVLDSGSLAAATPTAEWAFSYTLPATLAALRRLVVGDRSNQVQPPWIIQGALLFTDTENPTIEYTKVEDDTTKFPASFTNALGWLLASRVAPSLTGARRTADECVAQYEAALARAQANIGNQRNLDPEPESRYLSRRL